MYLEEQKRISTNHNDILLSICIGTYNRKKLLSSLLNEILKCENQSIEVIVCDNASTDGTWEMLQGVKDSRIRIFKNPENYGADYNWIRTLWLGSGKYLMNLNDRSFVDLESLKLILALMEDIDVGVIVACGMEQTEGLKIDTYEERACTKERLGEPGDIIYSGKVINEAKKICGFELNKNDTYIVWAVMMDKFFAAEKWYWCSNLRIVKGNPFVKYSEIKVNRVSRGYIFNGCPDGQRGMCVDKLKRVSDIPMINQDKYVRGIVNAYSRSFYWTIWNSYHNEAVCKRYDYIPPKVTFWLTETIIWLWKSIRTLKEEKFVNKDVYFYIVKKIWKEYIGFSWFRLTQSRIAKVAINLLHKVKSIGQVAK